MPPEQRKEDRYGFTSEEQKQRRFALRLTVEQAYGSGLITDEEFRNIASRVKIADIWSVGPRG